MRRTASPVSTEGALPYLSGFVIIEIPCYEQLGVILNLISNLTPFYS